MNQPVGIFLVDDEPDVTRGLCWLLESIQLPARAFNRPAEFISALAQHSGPACAVLDLSMPDMDGLETMQRLLELRPDVPIIFLSAHADVSSAVRAMKLGAVDFMQKPFDPTQFLDSVRRLSQLALRQHAERAQQHVRIGAIARLSAREKEVFEHLLEGASGKEIARSLNISPKTVEVHRANVLRKLEVSNLRQLALRFREGAR